MTNVSDARIAQMRTQRTASLEHTCVVMPKVRPGETATLVETPCTVKLSTGSLKGGFGARVGCGGGSAPMDRPDDVMISFPYGTQIKTNDAVRWVEDGQTYTVGQKRRAKSFDFDVTVQGIET